MNHKTGVLLVNVGSPKSPSIKDIRLFLKEFLSDPRVLSMPALIRWIIVNLFILPFRPKKILPKYQSIWLEEGFPLIMFGHQLKHKLNAKLDENHQVHLAMRYGEPALEHVLNHMNKQGVRNIRVVPLFPQYASATTGTVLEKIFKVTSSWQVIPSIQTVGDFYDHPGYIKAWVDAAREFDIEKYDHVLFSFHGLPEKHIKDSDLVGNHCLKSPDCCESNSQALKGCYRAQCFQTAKSIIAALKLSTSKCTVSFQSRLGKAKWIEPYTVATVQELAGIGCKKLLVFCPSFVADCLETTEEILGEVKSAFLAEGGEELDLVPSLNANDQWVKALKSMIESNA